jgi:aspartyl-tRNA(Asn)/glutamyl-tRNA(Gln) amidotransferase subunit C
MANSVDTTTVQHVAKLARLTLTDAEVTQFSEELSKILGMVDQLNQADISQLIEDTTDPDAVATVLRPDVPHPQADATSLLANAPVAEGSYFQVPKVLEG